MFVWNIGSTCIIYTGAIHKQDESKASIWPACKLTAQCGGRTSPAGLGQLVPADTSPPFTCLCWKTHSAAHLVGVEHSQTTSTKALWTQAARVPRQGAAAFQARPAEDNEDNAAKQSPSLQNISGSRMSVLPGSYYLQACFTVGRN